MITTAAITTTEKTAPTQGGHAGRAAGSPAARANDFLAAVNRIGFASSPAAAIAPSVQVPDTTQPTDDVELTSDFRDPPAPRDDVDRAPADRTNTREPAPATEEDAAAAKTPEDAPRQSAPAEKAATDAKTPETATPAPQSAEPAPSGPRAQAIAQSNPATAPQVPSDRAPVQTFQVAPTNTDTPNPQNAPQQARPQTAQATGPLRAQVVDAAAAEQLPQTSQTLSSRAALVAQSHTTKGAATADAALQDAATEPGVSSLLANATRAAGQGAQKGKSATRAGTPAQPAGALGAAAAQATQTPAQQTAAQATAPFQAQLQQNFANSQFGNGSGSNSTGRQSLAGRGETFGTSGTGQATPQFNLRAAAPSQAPKPTPQLPPRVVTNQVAVQIQKAAGQGHDRISIQLKPADLGRVEVRLEVGSDGRVAAVISADRADTLDLLQRDARILQNALQDAGLRADSDSLSFKLNGQNQPFAESGTGSPTSDDAADAERDAELPIATAVPQAGTVTSDHIDIRI